MFMRSCKDGGRQMLCCPTRVEQGKATHHRLRPRPEGLWRNASASFLLAMNEHGFLVTPIEVDTIT